MPNHPLHRLFFLKVQLFKQIAGLFIAAMFCSISKVINQHLLVTDCRLDQPVEIGAGALVKEAARDLGAVCGAP